MPKYRILKKYWRRPSTGKVEATFYLQEFRESSIFFRKGWHNMTNEICGWGDCFTEDITYKDLKEAQKHLKNLREPIPNDETYDK